MMRFFGLLHLLGAALLVAACGDDAGSGGGGGASEGGGGANEGGGGASEGGGGASEGGGGAAPTVTIRGQLGQMPMGLAVKEGDACFVRAGHPDLCSDLSSGNILTSGHFEIQGVPANTQGAVRFRSPTTTTFYWVLATGIEDLDLLKISIDTPALVESYYGATGLTPSDGGKVVLAEIFPTRRAGYAAELVPASGEGPYYYETVQGVLDVELTETSVDIAVGLFLNVDPADGPFSLSFERDGTTCTLPSYGEPTGPWVIPEDADVVYQAFECPP